MTDEILYIRMENKESTARPLGRPRKIDREQLLAAAEEIVSEQGVNALTIDAVAKALGITKGGVQYTVGSKEALLQALLERWELRYAAAIESRVGKHPTPRERMRAHIEETAAPNDGTVKCAALLAGLVNSPEHLETTQKWYADRVEDIDVTTPAGRQQRLAFLATEGAFLLKYFKFMQVSDEDWESMFSDIRAMVK